jgi:hypothetical protein
MKVTVDEDLIIESNTYGYQVKKFMGMAKDSRSGEERENWVTLAEYGSIKGCCNFILNLKIKESPAETIQELLQDVARIEEYIREKVTV